MPVGKSNKRGDLASDFVQCAVTLLLLKLKLKLKLAEVTTETPDSVQFAGGVKVFDEIVQILLRLSVYL